MLFSLWFYNFIKKMNKRKRIPFCGKKKQKKKRNSATIMISVDRKGASKSFSR